MYWRWHGPDRWGSGPELRAWQLCCHCEVTAVHAKGWLCTAAVSRAATHLSRPLAPGEAERCADGPKGAPALAPDPMLWQEAVVAGDSCQCQPTTAEAGDAVEASSQGNVHLKLTASTPPPIHPPAHCVGQQHSLPPSHSALGSTLCIRVARGRAS
jgi:hypothetical protein